MLNNIVHAYADYFKVLIEHPSIFSVYCGLTFPVRVDDQQALNTFNSFVELLENRLRTTVAWIRGDEKRLPPSGLGKPPSGRHFHCIFVALVPLEHEWIEHEWRRYVGMGVGISADGSLTSGGYAQVRAYDPAKKGLEYCLKSIGSEFCEWDFSDNIKYLSAQLHASVPNNAKSRRRLRRLQRQRPLPPKWLQRSA